jgi:hypothetical protein
MAISFLRLFAFGDSYLLLFRIASLDIDVIGTPCYYCGLITNIGLIRSFILVRPRLGTG